MGHATPALRVASYNIHRAVGTDRRQDSARIAAVIAEMEADIIGLQEVEWQHDHGSDESQFEYLTHLPGYRAIAGPNIRDHRGHYGNVLLTRLPARQVRQVDLSEPKREPRGAIDVEFGKASADLRVIVTHFGLGTRERWRQAMRLRDVISERPAVPTLILGDLNDWLPGNPTLRPLLRLCDSTPRPASYPSSWPVLALDRILAFGLPSKPDVRAHASPLARAASDHLPITATITTSGVAPMGLDLPPTAPPGRAAAIPNPR